MQLILASASPRRLTTGDSLRLVLRVEGRGNLRTLTPPRLARSEGLHVRGTTDGYEAGARTIVYDVAVKSAATTALPSIALSFFDPETRAYDTVRTDPV